MDRSPLKQSAVRFPLRFRWYGVGRQRMGPSMTRSRQATRQHWYGETEIFELVLARAPSHRSRGCSPETFPTLVSWRRERSNQATMSRSSGKLWASTRFSVATSIMQNWRRVFKLWPRRGPKMADRGDRAVRIAILQEIVTMGSGIEYNMMGNERSRGRYDDVRGIEVSGFLDMRARRPSLLSCAGMTRPARIQERSR